MNKSWQSPSETTITATWRQHRSVKLKLEEWGQLCMSRRSRLSSVIKWTKPYHPCENTLSSNPATVFLYLHICVYTRQPVGWTVLFLISTRLWAGIIWLAHKPSIPSPHSSYHASLPLCPGLKVKSLVRVEAGEGRVWAEGNMWVLSPGLSGFAKFLHILNPNVALQTCASWYKE